MIRAVPSGVDKTDGARDAASSSEVKLNKRNECFI